MADGPAGQLPKEAEGLGLSRSGVLVTGDLGYDAEMLEPLALRVPPGRYPVQVSVAYGRNAGLRVLLSSERVVIASDGPVRVAEYQDPPGGIAVRVREGACEGGRQLAGRFHECPAR